MGWEVRTGGRRVEAPATVYKSNKRPDQPDNLIGHLTRTGNHGGWGRAKTKQFILASPSLPFLLDFFPSFCCCSFDLDRIALKTTLVPTVAHCSVVSLAIPAIPISPQAPARAKHRRVPPAESQLLSLFDSPRSPTRVVCRKTRLYHNATQARGQGECPCQSTSSRKVNSRRRFTGGGAQNR